MVSCIGNPILNNGLALGMPHNSLGYRSAMEHELQTALKGLGTAFHADLCASSSPT